VCRGTKKQDKNSSKSAQKIHSPRKNNRGTIAGRFLHRVYAGGTAAMSGRAAGDAYSARNRAAAASAAAAAASSSLPPKRAPPPPPTATTTVAAAASSARLRTKPRLPRSGPDPASEAASAIARDALATQRRLASLGARRSAARITADAAAAARCPAPPPAPRRAAPLGEAEKQRLALLMEHRSKPPPPPAAPARRRRPADSDGDDDDDDEEGQKDGDGDGNRDGARTSRAGRRFARLTAEVAERERFLEAMRSAGALRREHVEAVRAQVADRLTEMRGLHAKLREEEEEEEGV